MLFFPILGYFRGPLAVTNLSRTLVLGCSILALSACGPEEIASPGTGGNVTINNVTNNPARSRYELVVDGHTAFVEYVLAPGVIDFTHTLVPKELGGRGIGSQLAAGVLADATARGLKGRPPARSLPGISTSTPTRPSGSDVPTSRRSPLRL